MSNLAAIAAPQPSQSGPGAPTDPGKIWTPQTEARAVRLFILEGFSASEVALALGGGLTRAAVIGKMRRLGFRKRETFRTAGLDVLRGRASQPRTPASARIERRLPPQRPPQPLPPLREVPATGDPTTLARLPANTCRWPIDDPGPGAMHTLLFCAGPTTGGVYCPAHRVLAGRSATPARSP